MKNMIISAIVVCSLVGCASTSQPIVENKPIIPPAPVKPTVAIPSWYNQAPTSEGILYSVGTASSRDLQLSQDMAILNAKTNLADRLNSRIRGQTKIYSNQNSSGDSITNNQRVERAVKNTVTDVDVAGYVVIKSETQQTDNVFRTFVMLEYSREQAADLIMERIRRDRVQDQQSDVDRAFEELDKLNTQ
jgi:hypothetical protein